MSVLNLKANDRAQRKLLMTFVDWGEGMAWDPTTDAYTESTAQNLSLLGARTEDSSIEFNPDTETTTDILGVTHTDFNKTEPQQDFDPFYVIGGSSGNGGKLAQYLSAAALANRITDYDSKFTVFIVAAYITDAMDNPDAQPATAASKWYCVAHKNCSIYPTSLGGDSYVSLPIEVHLSNDIVEGYTSGLKESDFAFTKGSL